MRNILEAIAKTVREIVCRVYSPFVARTMMFCFQYPVRCQIPHLRVTVLQVLLHAQKSFPGFIFPGSHRSEFCERFICRAISVWASVSGSMGFPTFLKLYLGVCPNWRSALFWNSKAASRTGTMAYVSSVALDEAFGKLIQPIKIVARIGDLERLEA